MRFWGLLLACVAVSSLITGCSHNAVVPDQPRHVGDCWVIPDARVTSAWNPAGVTSASCSETSNAYTYAVGTIQNAPDQGFISDGFVKATSFGTLPSVLAEHINTYCQKALRTFLADIPLTDIRSSRVVWTPSLPTLSQWQDGARWFSCETGVLQENTPYSSQKLETNPQGVVKLLDKVRASLTSYSLCVNTTSNTRSPFAEDARIAPCSQARWAMNQVALKVDYGTFYPGIKQAKKFATELCAQHFPQAVKVFPAALSELMWNEPDPSVGCWVSVSSEAVATPTPTPTPTRASGGSGGGSVAPEPEPVPTETTTPDPVPSPTETTEPPIPPV